ncbi:hypothetical protein PIROE2DRAFT_5550, partial [Piromyces sp. E2]
MEYKLFLISVFLVLFKLSEGQNYLGNLPTKKLTSTKNLPCPVYTVNSKPCVDNGGVFTMTTGADGCRKPTCIYPQTSTKVISSKALPTTTKKIPQQNCPVYTINSKPCVDNGGVFTMTTDSLGCQKPTCIYPQTSTKVISSKALPTTTTTKALPVTTTTTTKTRPPKNCVYYTVDSKLCENKGGVFTWTVDASNCRKPTCIMNQTQIQTSTTK